MTWIAVTGRGRKPSRYTLYFYDYACSVEKCRAGGWVWFACRAGMTVAYGAETTIVSAQRAVETYCNATPIAAIEKRAQALRA